MHALKILTKTYENMCKIAGFFRIMLDRTTDQQRFIKFCEYLDLLARLSYLSFSGFLYLYGHSICWLPE